MSKSHAIQRLRLIQFPCCGTMLCWINHRLPTYCPECGKQVIGELRRDPSHILIDDGEAVITYDDPEQWPIGLGKA